MSHAYRGRGKDYIQIIWFWVYVLRLDLWGVAGQQKLWLLLLLPHFDS